VVELAPSQTSKRGQRRQQRGRKPVNNPRESETIIAIFLTEIIPARARMM
jgi:hypothetical protein